LTASGNNLNCQHTYFIPLSTSAFLRTVFYRLFETVILTFCFAGSKCDASGSLRLYSSPWGSQQLRECYWRLSVIVACNPLTPDAIGGVRYKYLISIVQIFILHHLDRHVRYNRDQLFLCELHLQLQATLLHNTHLFTLTKGIYYINRYISYKDSLTLLNAIFRSTGPGEI